MSTSHQLQRSRGFTLIEVVVALAIGSLLVLMVHGVFGAVVDQAARLTQAQSRLEHEENARRWLSEAIASLDVGGESPGPFIGTAAEMEFSCLVLSPNGWHEPARVTVRVVNHRLVANLAGGEVLVLADGVAGADFDYLVESGEAAPWLRRWSSSVNPPLAVRLRVSHPRARGQLRAPVDTSLFLVGSRG